MTLQEQIEKSGAPVSGELLAEVVRRIVEAADPDKILLFGSGARGAMGPHSDLDLLVIKGGSYDYHRVITDIYGALAGVEPATEVVLATPEQVARYRDSFCWSSIQRSGKARSFMTERPFGPDDSREWLRRAKGNLRLASVIDPEVPLKELCYNAQQAAEKAIKGVFVSLGKPFPYTHNLKRLLDLIAEMIPVPANVLLAGELTRFALEARYPTVAPQITPQQSSAFLEIAEATVK